MYLFKWNKLLKFQINFGIQNMKLFKLFNLKFISFEINFQLKPLFLSNFNKKILTTALLPRAWTNASKK